MLFQTLSALAPFGIGLWAILGDRAQSRRGDDRLMRRYLVHYPSWTLIAIGTLLAAAYLAPANAGTPPLDRLNGLWSLAISWSIATPVVAVYFLGVRRRRS